MVIRKFMEKTMDIIDNSTFTNKYTDKAKKPGSKKKDKKKKK